MNFDFPFLVDNGRLTGWETDWLCGCTMRRWLEDGSYSVFGPDGKPIGSGDTKEEAIACARLMLTDRRRVTDNVRSKRVC